MFVALTAEGKAVISWETRKNGSAFVCPQCKELVTLRKGAIRVHHFAHRPGAVCPNAGESVLHMSIKRSLFVSLRDYPGCGRCTLERVLPGVRPDVSLMIGGAPVAIEVQLSGITEAEIRRRLLQYTELGIYSLWITARDSIAAWPESKCAATREWERFLHSLYRKRVYYWKCGATVIPARFNFGDYKSKARLGFLRDAPGGVKNSTKRSIHIARDFAAGTVFLGAGEPRVLVWRDVMSGAWTVGGRPWGW